MSTHKEADMLYLLGQVGGRMICWGVALTSENDIYLNLTLL